MLREADMAIGMESAQCAGTAVAWQDVDRALRGIAERRAGLDAEEARWLREAEALQIWKPLGMVSAIDYMDRVLGYAPRTAQERLRVARALGGLPALEDALACSALAFGAVRELTRVATPATEVAWRDAAVGKTVRQVEELVADHRPGDGPTDPKDPTARTHVVRFELSAETFARLRQARQAVDDERGSRVSDDALVAALCEGALGAGEDGAFDGRAKFQVAVSVCQRCRQGWQDGAGVTVAIEPAAVERALCDAQHIGSLDGAAPERAYQDITPSVARFVWRRDGGRCRVPGCRSARGLELHHIVHREDGGQHDALNLALLCSACHTAHHRGLLRISGTAAQLDVVRAATLPPAASKLDEAVRRAQAASDARVGASTGGAGASIGAHVGANIGGEHVGANVGAGAVIGGAHVGANTSGTRPAIGDAHVGANIGGAGEDISSGDAHVGEDIGGAHVGEDVGGGHVGANIGGAGEDIGGAHVGANIGGVRGDIGGAHVEANIGGAGEDIGGAHVGANVGGAGAVIGGTRVGANISGARAAIGGAHVGANIGGAHVGATIGCLHADFGAHVGRDIGCAYVGADIGCAHAGARNGATIDQVGGGSNAPLQRANSAGPLPAKPARREGHANPENCTGSDRAGEERAAMVRLAREALIGLGWSPGVSRAAVTAAATKLAEAATLERLVFEALRQCPRPRTTA